MHLVSTQSRFCPSGPWSISSTVTVFRVGLSAGGKPTGGQNSGPIGSRCTASTASWRPGADFQSFSGSPFLRYQSLTYSFTPWSVFSSGIPGFSHFEHLLWWMPWFLSKAQSCSTEYSAWTTSLTVVPTQANYGLYYLRANTMLLTVN